MKTTITAATIRFATAFTAIGTGIVAWIGGVESLGYRWRGVGGVSAGVEVRHGLLRLAQHLALAVGLASPEPAMCRPASPSDSKLLRQRSNRSSAVA